MPYIFQTSPRRLGGTVKVSNMNKLNGVKMHNMNKIKWIKKVKKWCHRESKRVYEWRRI